MSSCTSDSESENPMNNDTSIAAVETPVAERKDTTLTIHNHDRVDPYYWLSERENPAVVDYLNAENAYTSEVLAPTEAFQEKLFEEITGRIKQNDETVPYNFNGYTYYTRYESEKEYAIYCRKLEGDKSPEMVMIDANAMAEGHSYYSISNTAVSPNNNIVAFGEDTVSRRKYTIRFKDLETGEFLEDKIPLTTGSMAWANDNLTVFYSVKDEVTLRSYRIYKHTLGTDAANDELVYEEKDETFGTMAYRSKSGDYIMIVSYSTVANEYQFLDANTPNEAFKIVEPRERDHLYSVSQFGDRFYIKTNWEAQNYRLMSTSISAPSRANWKEEIPHRQDVMIEDMEIFSNFLVLEERKNGLTEMRIRPWEGEEYYMQFDEPVYVAWTSTNLEFGTEWLRFGYSSLTTPTSTYDFNMTTQERTLKKQQEVVGGYEASEYQAERHFATAADGTQVPISLVYKKGVERDEDNPTLLYAYGSYGNSIDPYFSSTRLSLLDRGFVFAIAHIRGGEEMGREWYEDGKLLNKKNTFTDYIDCADYLIEQKFTNPDKLFAMGGSAGGLLMGAVINMRPELFKGVVAAVPFVDVVTTMLDESIPLTTGEFDEWGNPKNEEYYHYILSYSPYDQVEAKEYPNLMVTTGFHDSQVQYWEPAKWVAKLRYLKTDNNQLIMHCNMETGHGGASGRFARYKEVAMEYAWLMSLIDITE